MLERPEYAKSRLSNIPQKFVDEYKLANFFTNKWIYFKICKGVYRLKKSEHFANDQLRATWKMKATTNPPLTPAYGVTHGAPSR